MGPGTNFNAILNANVRISLRDSVNKLATTIECNGDPNTVATDGGIFAVGCIARRSDLASGSALYQQMMTIAAPYWYVIT